VKEKEKEKEGVGRVGAGSDAFRLDGRVAVVTGAGSGIGRATALELSAAGARVVCADVSQPGLSATLEAMAGEGLAMCVDVSDRGQVAGLVEETVASFGRIDVMCNVAGIMHDSSVVDTEEADLDRVLAVNLKGVFFGCQEAARRMASQEPLVAGGFPSRGSIVNMVSSAIDTPAPGIVCYAMSKAAVAQLTRTLAVEMGRHGVRVNAVAPGFVVTKMTSRHFQLGDGSVDDESMRKVVETMAKMAPLRRVGEPEDIARTVLYLASDASSFVTGQVIRVNGGVSMV
jgi:3-oxoacyl-[acyl-carrier protein] reductase